MEGENRGRRRKRLDFSSRITILSIGFLLIFSEVCLLSSAEKMNSSQRLPGRKARFFGTGSKNHVRVRSSGPSSENNNGYDEEKRLVHTGPNPLHN